MIFLFPKVGYVSSPEGIPNRSMPALVQVHNLLAALAPGWVQVGGCHVGFPHATHVSTDAYVRHRWSATLLRCIVLGYLVCTYNCTWLYHLMILIYVRSCPLHQALCTVCKHENIQMVTPLMERIVQPYSENVYSPICCTNNVCVQWVGGLTASESFRSLRFGSRIISKQRPMANDERCNVIETQLLDFSFIYVSYVISKSSQRYQSINNKHETTNTSTTITSNHHRHNILWELAPYTCWIR